ncbi:MAG: carboxypeptidase-like regulatory domain-containing protein, partial [Blastocatellales bacterium]
MRRNKWMPGVSVRQLVAILTVILTLGLATGFVEAQVLYGSIIGNVTDQNGAVVPGATVTITNKATGQVRETVTDSEGVYSIVNILPGTFDL